MQGWAPTRPRCERSDHRDDLGEARSVSQALTESLDDIKQLLHVAPTSIANLINTYQPARGTLAGGRALHCRRRPRVWWHYGTTMWSNRPSVHQSELLVL
jgi:hypothetical protein